MIGTHVDRSVFGFIVNAILLDFFLEKTMTWI